MPVAGHDDDGGYADPEEEQNDAVRAARHEAELDRLAGMAATSDSQALDELLGLIKLPVLRYCRAHMNGPIVGLHTPDDVAQEVLLAVCGALARYRPGETAAMAFIYGIARNKVVDAYRAASRDHSEPAAQVPEAPDDDPGPEFRAVLSSEVSDLKVLLNDLKPDHREVLVLRIALQFTAEETARVIGSTPGAVRVTQHRALLKLRSLVAARA